MLSALAAGPAAGAGYLYLKKAGVDGESTGKDSAAKKGKKRQPQGTLAAPPGSRSKAGWPSKIELPPLRKKRR
jgi:hypothetical protein